MQSSNPVHYWRFDFAAHCQAAFGCHQEAKMPLKIYALPINLDLLVFLSCAFNHEQVSKCP